MNPSNPEMGQNPEQRIREELIQEMVAASEGTVGLYSNLSFSELEKIDMVAAQSERSGVPSDRLKTSNNGWGDYGERAVINPTGNRPVNGETVDFVTLEDGNIDVRYAFGQPGYRDATGRPGNSLDVQFTLSPDKAQKLQAALEGDPSFINQLIEAQTAAVGVDKKHWQRGGLMKPHYVDGFTTTVKEQDRVLKMKTVDQSGVVTDAAELSYGTNRSVMEKMQTVEQAPQTAEAPSEEDFYEEDLQHYKTEFSKFVDGLQQSGTADKDIIIKLEQAFAQKNEQLGAEGLSEEARDQIETYMDALEDVMDDLAEKQQKTEAVSSARAAVDMAHAAVVETSAPTYKLPEGTTSVGEYQDARGNTWIELSDGRQVRADSLDPGA